MVFYNCCLLDSMTEWLRCLIRTLSNLDEIMWDNHVGSPAQVRILLLSAFFFWFGFIEVLRHAD